MQNKEEEEEENGAFRSKMFLYYYCCSNDLISVTISKYSKYFCGDEFDLHFISCTTLLHGEYH